MLLINRLETGNCFNIVYITIYPRLEQHHCQKTFKKHNLIIVKCNHFVGIQTQTMWTVWWMMQWMQGTFCYDANVYWVLYPWYSKELSNIFQYTIYGFIHRAEVKQTFILYNLIEDMKITLKWRYRHLKIDPSISPINNLQGV